MASSLIAGPRIRAGVRITPDHPCRIIRMAAWQIRTTLQRMTVGATSSVFPPPDGVAKPGGASVNLYWLPLGAGGHCVRLNGCIFEAIMARIQHRPVCDLY